MHTLTIGMFKKKNLLCNAVLVPMKEILTSKYRTLIRTEIKIQAFKKKKKKHCYLTNGQK